MKKGNYEREYPEEVFCDKPEKKRYKGHYYRNLILRSISTFFIGLILTAFLKALGFGVFLFGCFLCAFGILFGVCLNE